MNASEPHGDVTCATGLGCIGATTRDTFVGLGGRAENRSFAPAALRMTSLPYSSIKKGKAAVSS
jgi:hypothetical protein